MTVNISLLAGAGWQFFDDSGVPLAGGKLFTYTAGTTTPEVTYSNSGGATQNTNPIILDAAGRVAEEIWLSEGILYKFVLKDANDVQIWSKDDIAGGNDNSIVLATLANTSDVLLGDALVGFRQSNSSGVIPGAVGRTVHQKLQESITPQDFGAVGDGTTDDTAAFATLESQVTGKDIDLQFKSYKVSVMPALNQYYNGEWVLPTGTSRGRWQGAQLTGAGRIAFGDGALADLPTDYSTGTGGTVVALGFNSMANMTQVKKSIAIGSDTQSQGTISRDNIAIGESSLKYVQAQTPDYSQTQREGSRNTAIGGNAQYFLTGGYSNTSVGRNTASCLIKDIGLTALGANAYGGYAPVGLSNEIENWSPSLSSTGLTNYSVAIGLDSLNAAVSNYSVAVGGQALNENKKSNGNVAVGPQALQKLDTNTWFNGGAYVALSISGTYVQSGTTLTITFPSHGLVAGDIAIFRLLDGGSQTFANDQVPAYVASATLNDIVIVSPLSITSSGSAQLYGKATAAQQPTNDFNSAVGGLAGFNLLTGVQNSIVGYRTLVDATNANYNVAVGFRALTGLTEALQCTAIGGDSLRFMVSGSLASGTGTNRIGLGYNTRVSGDNQVQLGDSATTTYAFGAVQNRSDIRDKTDIKDTALGLDFINLVRPVDFKWDMRDDYLESYEVDTGEVDETGKPVFETRLRKLDKDGSKKRKRYHHGVIAQELKAACDTAGIDFGGYQDHTVNGGDDVKTVGYEEFIAPLIKAVQELSAKVAKLEGKQ